jgi:hypothetical protein
VTKTTSRETREAAAHVRLRPGAGQPAFGCGLVNANAVATTDISCPASVSSTRFSDRKYTVNKRIPRAFAASIHGKLKFASENSRKITLDSGEEPHRTPAASNTTGNFNDASHNRNEHRYPSPPNAAGH